MLLDHVLYQAQVTATGGREGRAVSSDGVLEVPLTTPHALGGTGGWGTNPEQGTIQISGQHVKREERHS